MNVRSYPFGSVRGLEIDPMYGWLRDNEPLARVKLPYGEEGWLLTRYDDVRIALGDARFSLAEAVVRDTPRMGPQRMGAILTDLDPPEHTRLRRLLAHAFTVRRVEGLRANAARLAGELLDEMEKAGPPADLVTAFAVPLPGLMICELLGVPYDDRDHFQELAAAFMSITALTDEEKMARLGELAGYLAGLADKRRERQEDDLISALVVAQEEGDRLTADELVQLTVLLLGAGYDSTASQIVNSVYALLTFPDQLELLRSRPELMPGAVEELLRWIPPQEVADILPRYALQDVELSGGTVRAGEPVLLAKHAANRDPRKFPDPDRLNVTRDAKGQLSFGYGPHHCIGAQLARMDIQVALTALLARLPGLRLAVPADEVEWRTGMALRGPIALPISW
ncbi:cytochrome P450 [Kibdelosporangium aridum]|uniref:Cytochrome P450 n=1 Tax=Kibdelosporangium aridum TaxID=2030 RepID=A0A1W2FL12_KIBAR|nr:cytochrome P450 [Kibdelosporangium aridum]SMD22659.1 Cytochrome P450 [Kibdelosporangium aridum]